MSDEFKKSYSKASPKVKKSVTDTLKLLNENKIFTPGMKLRKLSGKDVWYIKTSEGNRITFDREGGNLRLRACGPHDFLRKYKKKK